MQTIMFSANNDNFISSFLMLMSLFSFPFLTVLACALHHNIEEKSSESGCLCLVPDFKGNAFIIFSNLEWQLLQVHVCCLLLFFLSFSFLFFFPLRKISLELTSVPIFFYFMWDATTAWLDERCQVHAQDLNLRTLGR